MHKLWAVGLGVVLFCVSTRAALYYGPTYDKTTDTLGIGFVNGGKLQLTDNGTTISAVFNHGSGSFNNNMVIFIDTGVSGFIDTTAFTDTSSGYTKSISGYNGSSRATTAFGPGFQASYAIALQADMGGHLFKLAGNGAFTDLGTVSLNPLADGNPSYTFNFKWSTLGLTSGSGFKFEVGWVNSGGNSYNQGLEPFTGSAGWGHTITFTRYDTYGVVPVPEMVPSALAICGGLFVVVRLWRRRAQSAMRDK